MIETPNYKLELYETLDAPDLRQQYNASMGKIDSALLNFNNDNVVIHTSLNNHTSQIEAIQTLQTQHSTELETLNNEMEGLGITSVESAESFLSTVNNHTTSIERQGDLITTQQGMFSGLGIESADDAVDLKKDIDDAHTQAMVNQSDIAKNSLLGDRIKIEFNFPTSLTNSGYMVAYLSPNKNFMQFIIYLELIGARTINLEPIPGTSVYGYKTLQLDNYRPSQARQITAAFQHIARANEEPHYVLGAGYDSFYIGTDGYIYLFNRSTNTASFGETRIFFSQQQFIILDTGNYTPPTFSISE